MTQYNPNLTAFFDPSRDAYTFQRGPYASENARDVPLWYLEHCAEQWSSHPGIQNSLKDIIFDLQRVVLERLDIQTLSEFHLPSFNTSLYETSRGKKSEGER
jgi:hypothetical protein